MKAVTEVWGGKRVGIRLSPATTEPGKTPLDSDPKATFGAYIEALTGSTCSTSTRSRA